MPAPDVGAAGRSPVPRAGSWHPFEQSPTAGDCLVLRPGVTTLPAADLPVLYRRTEFGCRLAPHRHGKPRHPALHGGCLNPDRRRGTVLSGGNAADSPPAG